MRTTPLPPHLQFSTTPFQSSFDLHTPTSEDSFDRVSIATGSNSFSNVPHQSGSMRPKIETRQPAFTAADQPSSPFFAQDNITVSSMSSTANKDYLYYVYTKQGHKWDEEPVIEEIQASQSQIKKRSESTLKKHSALLHLQHMSATRRGQINKHLAFLNSEETDGSTWEPVWIDNTKIKQKGNSVEVKTFEIIFARKRPKPIKVTSPPVTPLMPEIPIFNDEILRNEKRKSKEPRKAPATTGIVDDPFGQTQWFGQTGEALGGPGSASMPLPPFISQEKPIGKLKPRIIAGLDPDQDDVPLFGGIIPGVPVQQAAGLGIPGISAFGKHKHSGSADGIFEVKDDKRTSKRDSRDRGRRTSTRSRSRSRPRPSLDRVAEWQASQKVRFPDGLPGSSGASSVSGDVSFIFDEVEELSSMTSEDTTGSPAGRKIYRVIPSSNREHRPGPTSPHGSNRFEMVRNETILEPEHSRRKPGRTAERPQTQKPYGIEQPLTRRDTSPRYKPLVTQPTPPSPTTPAEIPPIAVYPDFFEKGERQQRSREYDDVQRVENYMQDTVREKSLKDREDEVEKKEAALRVKARIDEEKRQREVMAARDQLEGVRLDREFGKRRSVYTHDPREIYGSRRP